MMQIYTIGGYGHTEASFLRTLQENGIQLFVDIRQRRGMRGSTYSFLNSQRLQDNLNILGISYLHLKKLAPSDHIRNLQKEVDNSSQSAKRDRSKLSNQFIVEYTNIVLSNINPSEIISKIKNYNKVCFFCVEKEHEACHRSIVTTWLEQEIGKARHI